MADLAHGTAVAIEALVLDVAHVRATVSRLEVLGVNGGGQIRATLGALEALTETKVTSRSTGLFLECLCQMNVFPPYVPGIANPWTIKPDWANGITERLGWKTDVLTSQTGREQRRKLRNSPRRIVEGQFTMFRDTRRLYDSYMVGPAAGLWRVPLWWERRTLDAVAEEGDHVLEMRTEYSEFVPGCTVMLLGSTPFIFEMVKVIGTSDANDQLYLANSLQQTWPRGTPVYMTKLGQLIGQHSGTRKADDAYQVTLQFQVVEPNDYPALALDLFGTYPFMPFTPNDVEDTTTEYTRMLAEFDNELGIPIRLDTALQAFRIQQFHYMTHGRLEYAEFRSFLYSLAGRLTPLWVPTFFQDLRLVGDRLAADDYVYVARSGYTDFADTTNPGRRVVNFQFRDGTSIQRSVMASIIPDADRDFLRFDAPLGREVTSINLKRLCFVQLMRSDQDEVEVIHHTDTLGATTFKLTFRSTEEDRVGGDYSIAVFNGSYVRDADPPALPVDVAVGPPPPVVPPPVTYPDTYLDAHADGGEGGR